MRYVFLGLLAIIAWQYVKIAYLKKYAKLLAKELELERKRNEPRPGVEPPERGPVITIKARR